MADGWRKLRTLAEGDIDRIVPGHDPIDISFSQGAQLPPAVGHLRNIGNYGKRTVLQHVGEIVGGIGRQHQPPQLRPHAHGLEPACMAADVMHGNTRNDLAVPVVEYDLTGVNHPHGSYDVVRLVCV